jgi:hypothetical protein
MVRLDGLGMAGGKPGPAIGVDVGKVEAGEDHAMHELLHLGVATLLDLGNLALVAEVGGALAEKQVERGWVASAEDRAELGLVVAIGGGGHGVRIAERESVRA